MSLTAELWTHNLVPSTKKPRLSSTSPKMTTTTTAMTSTATLFSCDLRQEDDWTKVKDPKEKKRIQNRVAQRTYRRRMKARLGELQARLDSHEAQRTDNDRRPSLDDSASLGFDATASVTTKDRRHSTSMDINGSPSPNLLADQNIDPMLQQGSLPSLPQILPQPRICKPFVENQTNPIFVHASARSHIRSTSLTYPIDSPGLISPPNHEDQRARPRHRRDSADFVADGLELPSSHLCNRMGASYPGNYPGSTNVSDVMDPMSSVDPLTLSAFAPGPPEDISLGFDSPLTMWKQEAQQPPCLNINYQWPKSADSAACFTPTDSPTDTINIQLPGVGAATDKSPSESSINERFEYIMSQVEAVGFDDFESMASSYYTQTFEGPSPLAQEQRQGRGRRLPQVISDVSNAAVQWDEWERKGFQEGILKTAGSMLNTEGMDARPQLQENVSTFLNAQEAGDAKVKAEAVQSIKATIQDKLPNSWAMLMALTGGNHASWQNDQSNTALATALLLNFSCRLPRDELLYLIDSCL